LSFRRLPALFASTIRTDDADAIAVAAKLAAHPIVGTCILRGYGIVSRLIRRIYLGGIMGLSGFVLRGIRDKLR
jgi:hypothetical protein